MPWTGSNGGQTATEDPTKVYGPTGQLVDPSEYAADSAAYGKGQAAAGDAAGVASTNAYGQGFTDQHTTGYNFGTGTNTSIFTDPNTGDIYFGGTGSGLNSGANFTAKNPDGSYYAGGAAGYIDPNKGEIVYGTNAHENPQGFDPNSFSKDVQAQAQANTTTKDYYYAQDYGMGPSALGVIPLMRNAQGTPTEFYAGVQGGGGKVFTGPTALADATASVAAYKTWYDTQHPAGTAGSQIAPTAAPQAATGPAVTSTTDQPQGILTVPGAGENYFDSTKDFYGQPTNAQQVFNQTPNQPTNSQQQWNAYSGIYGNPGALDDIYKTGQQEAQSQLERQASSQGWGDSGAAARATGNLGIKFTNAKLAAEEGWATTGQQLAGSADTANNALTSVRGGLATNADTQNLSKVTGGQTAANSAENLLINRETGGLNSATALANDQATLVASGMNAADAQNYQSQLTTLQLQVQQGQLTAQQAYTQAQNLGSTMGVVGSTGLNTYLLTKFGISGTGTSSTGPSYTTQTINY